MERLAAIRNPATAPAAALPVALRDFDSLPDSAFVRRPVVLGLLGGINAVTLWRWTQSGKWPSPARIGGNVAWRVADVRKALADLSTS
ncbi:hypothetical protein CKO37_15500 [Rubrivivax gelatinosus]|nr:hypothetical protein [Rubrivivax gelatinosus]